MPDKQQTLQLRVRLNACHDEWLTVFCNDFGFDRSEAIRFMIAIVRHLTSDQVAAIVINLNRNKNSPVDGLGNPKIFR